MNKYDEMKAENIKGWQTWNTRSVLSHVFMPNAFAINLAIKGYTNQGYLKEVFTGQYDDNSEKVYTLAHNFNSSYTEIDVKWNDIKIKVQSTVYGDDLILLATPIYIPANTPALVVETGILWNSPGYIEHKGEYIQATLKDKNIKVYPAGTKTSETYVAVQTPYFCLALDKAVGVSTGVKRNIEEIKVLIAKSAQEYKQKTEKYGKLSEPYNALQNAIAWNTIYEANNKRVLSPVSRVWSYSSGYSLFCWDNYFAGYLASVDNKFIAYANVIEITSEKTKAGFVPNTTFGNDRKSLDRSQPPVGSMVVKELYRKYKDKWLLEYLFDDLFTWNRWWVKNRMISEGLFAWGSNDADTEGKYFCDDMHKHSRQGAAYESGLDNTAMYDNIPFDKETNMLKLADVGLTGLFIMDCKCLANIAKVLGKNTECQILLESANLSSEKMNSLWDDKQGIFANKRTDTGEFSDKISPTNFYALFSDKVTEYQKNRVINEYFYNEEKFWGEWMLPAITRDEASYQEQDYWRGRVWAPLNYLVYLAFRYQNLSKACKDLSDKSVHLLMKEWDENKNVCENYNSITGSSSDMKRSNRYYHWGALLALISLIENGFIEAPENSIE